MRYSITRLPLREHALLFMLPAMFIAFYAGLLKFTTVNAHRDIRLPVYHTYDFGCVTDYNAAVVYADGKGSLTFGADRVNLLQPSFFFPETCFPLYDTAVNRARSIQLADFLDALKHTEHRTVLLLYADGRLPYPYLELLLRKMYRPRYLPGQRVNWYRMHLVVNWQPGRPHQRY